MKVLMVDNYDSFTFNLVQYIQEILGRDVDVCRNDALTLDEVVDVSFAPDGDGTVLTLTHRGIPDDGQSVSGHRQGVSESLDMLAEVLA